MAGGTVVHADIADALALRQVRHQGHHGNARRDQLLDRLVHRWLIGGLEHHALAAGVEAAQQLVVHGLRLDFFEQVKARCNTKRRQAAQLRDDRRLHRRAEALGRVHDHVDMERAPHRQAVFFLGLQLVQRLLDTPAGLRMHAAALVQHAVDRGFAHTRLRGELLDGEVFCTFEHHAHRECSGLDRSS